VVRDAEAILAPDDDVELRAGDELLLVGWPSARRALSTVLVVDAAREYVLSGRRVPTSWVWRRLTSTEETEVERAGRS
jgi:voltage-gated potassium channel